MNGREYKVLLLDTNFYIVECLNNYAKWNDGTSSI